MTFLRNLQRDLIDKKLWPLAIVLVVALVAVPMVLGGGGDPVSAPAVDTAAPPTASAAVAAPATAEVAVAVEEPLLRKRSGKTRDPFKQQFVQKAVTAPSESVPAAPTTPDAGKTTGGTTPGTGGTTPGTPKTATPTPQTPKSPDVDPLDVYRVSLRFGEPGELRTIRDIARLSPLPNAERPFFVFLGVLSGGKKAVFLVSSDVTATGDGVCRPSKANCESVELEKGDTEFFDLETESGVVQYQLDLVTLKRRVPLTRASVVAAQARARAKAARTKAAKAKKARDEAVKKGAEDTGSDDLGSDRYRWDEKRGVLVRVTKSSKVSMNVGGDLMGVLREAGDGLVALADGSWQAGDPAATTAPEAPAVVGGP